MSQCHDLYESEGRRQLGTRPAWILTLTWYQEGHFTHAKARRAADGRIVAAEGDARVAACIDAAADLAAARALVDLGRVLVAEASQLEAHAQEAGQVAGYSAAS